MTHKKTRENAPLRWKTTTDLKGRYTFYWDGRTLVDLRKRAKKSSDARQ